VGSRKVRGKQPKEVLFLMRTDMWTYSATDARATDLDGFDVVAADGEIGKIDEATDEVGASYIVVDTGPWIFGRKVVLPAGAIERIDLDNRKVEVRFTKDQIKGSPELDMATDDYRSPAYRERISTYYADYYS
jgi:PRC-barrel domain